ncbi:MAG: pirin family protein [Pseudomonadota bacterium]
MKTSPTNPDCDVWTADSASVGPLSVFRPLPHPRVSAIGPFVLLDHFGPVPAPAEKLPAHPHAGIEVMTYLLEGANEHEDSQGNIGQIGAGGAQWMKSGRGILHTERNLLDRAKTMHGLQIWARMPIDQQDSQPEYQAFQADEMPEWQQDGATLRLLAGAIDGRVGPIPLLLPSLMVHGSMGPGARCEIALPDAGREYGLYVIAAPRELTLNEHTSLGRGQVARLSTSTSTVRLNVAADGLAEFFLFGGVPAPQPLLFGGPFVLDSPAALTEAKRRFSTGAMGTLDGVPF